jgi:hypothetical protein
MVSLTYKGTTLRVSSDHSVHVLYGNPEELNPEDAYRAIFGEKDAVSVKYTMNRFTYAFHKDLKMTKLNNILRQFELEKYVYHNVVKVKRAASAAKTDVAFKRITFTKIKNQKMSFIIFSSGKIQIVLTRREDTADKLNASVAKKWISKILTDHPEVTLDRANIANFASFKITNIRPIPGKKVIKPQVCNTKGKITPVPYSFGGKCNTPGYSPSDEGISYSKSKDTKVNRLDWYGPCCYKVTGKSAGKAKFDSTSLPDTFVKSDLSTSQLISKSGDKSKRKEFIKRLINGYKPEGIDNKAANYIPGTTIIEKRGYKGLKELLSGNETNRHRMITTIMTKYAK